MIRFKDSRGTTFLVLNLAHLVRMIPTVDGQQTSLLYGATGTSFASAIVKLPIDSISSAIGDAMSGGGTSVVTICEAGI